MKKRFGMKMSAKHLWICAACAFIVVVAILAAVPALIAVGALMCGAMMAGMVWMMMRMGGPGDRRS